MKKSLQVWRDCIFVIGSGCLKKIKNPLDPKAKGLETVTFDRNVTIELLDAQNPVYVVDKDFIAKWDFIKCMKQSVEEYSGFVPDLVSDFHIDNSGELISVKVKKGFARSSK